MTLLGQMLVNDGIEQGIERGRANALRELALEMRKNGKPYEKVSKYTKATVEMLKAWEQEETSLNKS